MFNRLLPWGTCSLHGAHDRRAKMWFSFTPKSVKPLQAQHKNCFLCYATHSPVCLRFLSLARAWSWPGWAYTAAGPEIRPSWKIILLIPDSCVPILVPDLVSAEVELIFFLTADTLFCFQFSKRVVLITFWGSSCCPVVLTVKQWIFGVPCTASEQVHKKLERVG